MLNTRRCSHLERFDDYLLLGPRRAPGFALSVVGEASHPPLLSHHYYSLVSSTRIKLKRVRSPSVLVFTPLAATIRWSSQRRNKKLANALDRLLPPSRGRSFFTAAAVSFCLQSKNSQEFH